LFCRAIKGILIVLVIKNALAFDIMDLCAIQGFSQSINQSINQPTNHPTNQPTNQSINQCVKNEGKPNANEQPRIILHRTFTDSLS
jgi:hypothetical protein